MPVHIRLEPDAVVIQFDRDGEEPETQLVQGDGERVLLFAIAMLIGRRRLYVGDRLTIRTPADQ
jgi:hypothetical protein